MKKSMDGTLTDRLKADLKGKIINPGDLLILVSDSGKKSKSRVEIPAFAQVWAPESPNLSLSERHFPNLHPDPHQNESGRYLVDLGAGIIEDNVFYTRQDSPGFKVVHHFSSYAHMSFSSGGVNYVGLDDLIAELTAGMVKNGDLLILGLPLDRRGRSQSGVPAFVREWYPKDLILQLSETYSPGSNQEGLRRYSLDLDERALKDKGPDGSQNSYGFKLVQQALSYMHIKIKRNKS